MSYEVPNRSRGFMRLSVKQFAAVGDGIHDDTLAFQCAIDFLPMDGGTIYVPAGTYLIDPTVGVLLRSNMKLEMAADAVLVAKQNDVSRYNVLMVDAVENVEIEGGKIVGDRLTHTYTVFGTKEDTHEWGHGIRVRKSSRVTIRGVRVELCTGDGLSIGGNDIVLYQVYSTGNRRQGLTIGGGSRYRVYDCDLLSTGHMGDNKGTAPMAGCDIEPDAPGIVDDVIIEGCRISDNGGCGLLLYTGTTATAPVPAQNKNITIRNNAISNNTNGIETTRPVGVKIEGNMIFNQRASGVAIGNGSSNVVITQNTFWGNYTRGTLVIAPRIPEFDLTGVNSTVSRDILIKANTIVSVLTNHYK